MGHGVACSEAREWQRTGPDGVVSASQTKRRGAQDELLALPAACLNSTLIITSKDAVCSAGARRGEASRWGNETRRKFGEVGELSVVPSSLNSLPSPHPPRPVFMFIARSSHGGMARGAVRKIGLCNGIRIMSCKQADLHLFEIFVSRCASLRAGSGEGHGVCVCAMTWHGMAWHGVGSRPAG
ncbi:hypothetical protein CMUS01_08317 [Colletotrichum musicola]|uniref:Uncharacterized protein n=1 Tax=Colletotrichum musicola TaxID=2175873 RepID=A0A8H6ND96_9PEZI|nr:hypothetical protein CMUS01_08317 [Colletotrichum musicola]